ncbi:MAG: hypothetical protein PHY00_04280 [Bacilli bacterium]|nr:hypothetical protein [Bacilli bacterium]
MSNRKMIFAVVVFIVFGLFIHSFANPDSDAEPVDKGNQNYEQNENNNNDGSQNVDEIYEQEDNEVNAPGNLVEKPRNNPTIPTALDTDYNSLKKAIKDGEKIINNEEVEEFIESIAEELGVEIKEGLGLITAGSTQNNVTTKANTIKRLIAKVKTYVEDKLKETVDYSNVVLNSILESSNTTFVSVLDNLKKEIKDETIKVKELKDKVSYINNVNSLIIRARELEAELLKQIENAEITLVPSTTNLINTNITLELEIKIEDQALVSSYEILDEEDNVLSTDKEAVITQNGEYIARVTFVTEEEKLSKKLLVDNIDKESPIVQIIVIPKTKYGEIFGKEVIITGEVDASENNIKSHWFEITNPDGTTSKSYNLNTNELSYSFNLDTTKGSGEYTIRYVATDKAGNRNDDPKYTNSTVKTIIVDATDPVAKFSPNGTENWVNYRVDFTVSTDDFGSGIKVAKTKWKATQPEISEFATGLESSHTVPKEYTNEECYLWVYLEDYVGNWSITSSNAFKIDRVEPKITGVENGGIYKDEVTINIEEDRIASITVNEEEISLGTNNQYIFTEEKQYNIVVRDVAGNESIVNFEIYSDVIEMIEHVGQTDDGSALQIKSADNDITLYKKETEFDDVSNQEYIEVLE